MYNDQLVYKVVIWVFFGISLSKEKEALILQIWAMYYKNGFTSLWCDHNHQN